jgi:hypothetical protein
MARGWSVPLERARASSPHCEPAISQPFSHMLFLHHSPPPPLPHHQVEQLRHLAPQAAEPAARAVADAPLRRARAVGRDAPAGGRGASVCLCAAATALLWPRARSAPRIACPARRRGPTSAAASRALPRASRPRSQTAAGSRAAASESSARRAAGQGGTRLDAGPGWMGRVRRAAKRRTRSPSKAATEALQAASRRRHLPRSRLCWPLPVAARQAARLTGAPSHSHGAAPPAARTRSNTTFSAHA